MGEDTHGGTAGDTATAKEELILVYNYGRVPATQRGDRISRKLKTGLRKSNHHTAMRIISAQGYDCAAL